MNLDLVESFYWVATLKSITEGARKMFVTQLAMTARMNKLESELQVELLDPREKRVRLTLAGTRFDGFGVAMLPQATIERVPAREGLRVLTCATAPSLLPLFASWHLDPTSNAVEAVVERAVEFARRHRTGSRAHKNVR